MTKTTHDEKVAMLREETEESMTGMWWELLRAGTEEARDQFQEAAEDAGWVFEFNPKRWWRRG